MERPINDSTLVYVLCQIVFSNILSMEQKYLPDFQDKVRKYFPLFSKSQNVSLEMRLNQRLQPQDVVYNQLWSFLDNKKEQGFILSSNSLCFNVSVYKNFELFKQDFFVGYKALKESVEDINIERIGLRYVNAIDLNDSRHSKINPVLKGYTFESNSRLIGSFSSSQLRLDDACSMFIKSAYGVRGNPIPVELMPCPLKIKANAQAKYQVLDFDCIKKMSEPLVNLDADSSVIDTLHEHIEKAYRSVWVYEGEE